MTKTLTTLFALSLVSTAAMAQTSPQMPAQMPAGPTLLQCTDGWKTGMQWSKEQFEAACLALRQSEKK